MRRFLAVGLAVLALAFSVIILDAPAKISRPIVSVGNTVIESLTGLKTSFFEAYDPAQSLDVSLVGISNHHATSSSTHIVSRSGEPPTQAAVPKSLGGATSAADLAQLQTLVNQTFQSYIAAGKLIGLQGPQGPQGVQGPQGSPGSAGSIQTFGSGGNSNDTSGTILGVTELSARDLTVSNSTALNNLTVSGSFNASSLNLTNALTVSNGGTGVNTLTPNGILFGNGTSAIGSTDAGTPGQCLQSNGGSSAPAWGSCTLGTGRWDQLQAPTSNLALSMGSDTTTLTFGNTTGSSNLFTLTDGTSNTGIGYLLNVTTATGSTLKPLQVVAAGTTALTIDATGNLTANNLASSGAVITGGTINGTPIGATTAAAGTFSTLAANGTTTTNDLITVSGPVVDIRGFGAKCDDSTDDTSAIQSAINSLPSSGGAVSIPVNSVCKTTVAITINSPNVQLFSYGSTQYVQSTTPSTYIDFKGTNQDALDVVNQGFIMTNLAIKYPATTGGALSTPAAPTLSTSTGGSLGNAPYYVKVACTGAHGDTLASTSNTITPPTNGEIIVTAPSCGSTAVGYDVYSNNVSGVERLNNTIPVPLSTNYVITSQQNHGPLPLVNASANCAVYESSAARFNHIRLYTGVHGSLPFGVANGLCASGSNTVLADSYIDGFNYDLLLITGANNTKITGDYLREANYGLVYGNGANSNISNTDFEQNYLGNAWVLTSQINFNGDYFEQQNIGGNNSFVLKLGDNTNSDLVNGQWGTPNAIDFRDNFIQCNDFSGKPPIIIQEVTGLTFNNVAVSNCGNQSTIIQNTYANSHAGIIMTNDTSDSAVTWIDNTTGVIESNYVNSNSTLSNSVGTLSFNPSVAIQGSITVGQGSATTGTIVLQNASNAFTTTLQASTSVGNDITFTLPSSTGANGQVLQSDGNGTLSWVSAGTGSGTVNSGAAGQLSYYAASGSAVSAASLLWTDNTKLGIGTSSPAGLLDVSEALQGNPSATVGAYLSLSASTFTDNATSGSSTATGMAFNSIAAPTLAATNSSVTTTNAYGLYLGGSPIAGTNETLTNTAGIFLKSNAVGSGTNGYGVLIGAPTGPTSSYAGYFGNSAPTSHTTAMYGIQATAQATNIAFNMANAYAVYATLVGDTNSANHVTNGYGVYSSVGTSNNRGVISNGYGVYTKLSAQASGTITTGYGLYVDTPVSAGAFGTNYGLYINSQQGPTTTYALYQAGSSDKSYFAGSIGINTTSPASKLDITATGTFGAAGVSGINSEAHTVTLSGANPTTYPTFYANSLGAMTLNGTNTNQTVTTGSTLYVATPVAGANVTVTNLYPINTQTGAYLSSGGTWTNASDRNLKEDFTPVDPAEMLNKINTLPVTEWDYKTEGPTVKHIGPVAQDFYAAFGVGNNNTSISTIDPAGIALLGIQALSKQVRNIQGAFGGNIGTNEPLTVAQPVVLQSTLTVLKPVTFSGDTVGEAEIKAGATSVRIAFSEQYQYQPIVTITPKDQAVLAFVTDDDATGFTIKIATPISSDVTFYWHAFGGEGAKLTVSDGTTQDIALVLPPSSSAAGTSGSGTVNAEPASGSAQSSASSSANGNQTDSAGTATPVSSPDTTTPSNLDSASITTSTQSGATSSSGTGNAAQPGSSEPVTTLEADGAADGAASSTTATSPQGQAVNAVQ